jgi:flagellar hook-associated protein 3 FlgL
MRISTVQMQDRSVNAMLERQAELSRTQQQVATGKRILTPSDDVLGTTQILAFNETVATYKQYQDNSGFVENRLILEEAALTQSIDVLQRVNELAVQAGNPTYGANERALLAVEVRQLLSETISIANTTDSNGDYLFAGFNVDTAPITATEVPANSGLFTYAYTGDTGQNTIQVGATRFIPTGDNGQDVFMNVPVSGGGNQNIFETIEQLALDLESNTVTATRPADIALAMENLSTFRTQTGARQNAIESQRVFNNDIVFQGEKMLSSIKDLDYAEAISRLNLQLTGLQASQQSYARIQNLSLFSFL